MDSFESKGRIPSQPLLGRDKIEDYAKRKGMHVVEVEKWLGPFPRPGIWRIASLLLDRRRPRGIAVVRIDALYCRG